MGELNKFFKDYLNKQPLFKNKKVLQANYTPDKISHRDEQIDTIAGILAPSLRLEKPSNLFLYGKAGCVSGSTLVFTNEGYKEIKSLRKDERVLSFNLKTKLYEWERFKFVSFVNKDKLLKISLDNGLGITVTKDHPFLLKDLKWVKADELKCGDDVLLGFNFQNKNFKDIPLGLARLLAFIISDGNINEKKKRTKDDMGNWYNSHRQRLRYTSIGLELLKLFQKDLSDLFPYKATIRRERSTKNTLQVEVISKLICDYLAFLGVPKGKKSYIVRVPRIIFECKEEIQREFLKALFSGDGTVSTNTYMVEYYSNSKGLLTDVMLLLHQMGIRAKVIYKKAKCNGKYFDSYRLYISGVDNLTNFYKKIGFYHKGKQEKLKHVLEKRYKFKKKYNNNLLSVKVDSIEEVYEGRVYDLTVPKNHNFIANGIISHNTGKTLVTQHVCSQILDVAKEKGLPLKIVYLNCKMKRVADTEYRLIVQLSREFGKEIPATGLPTDEVYKIFLKYIDSDEQLIILVLDEIDQLVKKAGDEILYNLTRINSELQNVELSIIGISNDLLFMDDVDPRVKSSLSEEELVFPPYNAIQIQDILRQRSRIGFRESVVMEGVIEKCAAYAAREHGDARRALELLRVAGEIAERKNKSLVDIDDIDVAEEKIERDKVIDIVHTQPKQFQLVLLSILNIGETVSVGQPIFTGDVYEIYKDLCLGIRLKPLTQRRVSDIIAELDMLGIINAKVISKGRYGRTREIRLAIPSSTVPNIKTTLKEGLNL